MSGEAPTLTTTDLISAAVIPVATTAATQVATELVGGVSDTVATVQGDVATLQADFLAHKTEMEQRVAALGEKGIAAAIADPRWFYVIVGAMIAVGLADAYAGILWLTQNNPRAEAAAAVLSSMLATMIPLNMAHKPARPPK